MKEVGTCHWNSDDEGATNSSGFTALPGGYYGYGGFNSMGDAGYWWIPLQNSNDPYLGRCRIMSRSSWSVTRTSFEKHFGMSVRAIKN